MQDVERLEQFIAHHSVEFAAALFGPLLSLLLLSWLDYRLALTAFIPLPLAMIIQALLLRRITPLMQRYLQQQAKVEAAVVEFVRNVPLIKLYCQTRVIHFSLDRELKSQTQTTMELSRRTIPAWSLFSALLTANTLLLLPTAFFLFDHGQLTIEQVFLALLLTLAMQRSLLDIFSF